MDPLTLGLAGAGAGLFKSLVFDKPKEERDRKLQALTALYSPWTGQKPHQVQEADTFGNLLKYGMTGATLGQSLNRDAASEEYQKRYLDSLDGRALTELPAYYSPYKRT